MPRRSTCLCGHPLEWSTWWVRWVHVYPQLQTAGIRDHEPRPRR